MPREPRHQFDRAYLERLVAGDPETERHFTKYFGDLLSIKLRSRLRSPALIEDAKQETFLRVLKTLREKSGVQSPGGYKLYARDVADHPLNADLVTISACRSAGERTYAGEGLVGFSWASLRAGANRVIAGLWDVDDRSTAELMRRVYTDLAAGRSPGAALRAAKLGMIKTGGVSAKPYYWGPFEMFIGSRVIP